MGVCGVGVCEMCVLISDTTVTEKLKRRGTGWRGDADVGGTLAVGRFLGLHRSHSMCWQKQPAHTQKNTAMPTPRVAFPTEVLLIQLPSSFTNNWEGRWRGGKRGEPTHKSPHTRSGREHNERAIIPHSRLKIMHVDGGAATELGRGGGGGSVTHRVQRGPWG